MTTSLRFKRAVVLDTEGDIVRDGLRLLHREARDAAYGVLDESAVVKIYAVMAFTDEHGNVLEGTAPDMFEVERRHIETTQADEEDYYGVRYGLYRPGGTEPVATYSVLIDGRS